MCQESGHNVAGCPNTGYLAIDIVAGTVVKQSQEESAGFSGRACVQSSFTRPSGKPQKRDSKPTRSSVAHGHPLGPITAGQRACFRPNSWILERRGREAGHQRKTEIVLVTVSQEYFWLVLSIRNEF